MTTMSDILETKGPDVRAISPEATVIEAVEEMCRCHVGALLVTHPPDVPAGMISERDVMARVVLARLDPAATRVSDVMTAKLTCVTLRTSVDEAMALMTERRCRHLPVVMDGHVVGLVSIGDLVRSVTREEETEIRFLHEYIEGRYPG